LNDRPLLIPPRPAADLPVVTPLLIIGALVGGWAVLAVLSGERQRRLAEPDAAGMYRTPSRTAGRIPRPTGLLCATRTGSHDSLTITCPTGWSATDTPRPARFLAPVVFVQRHVRLAKPCEHDVQLVAVGGGSPLSLMRVPGPPGGRHDPGAKRRSVAPPSAGPHDA
jgi:hypothetical protein